VGIIPINYNSIKGSERYAQLYRLQELLRLEHNSKGKLYSTLQITESEWKYYLNNEFTPKEDLIISELLKYRQLIKEDTSINTTLTDVII